MSTLEPRDQLRAVADDMMDTLLKLAQWGLHDSNRAALREYAEACRASLAVAADAYERGVAAGRRQAAEALHILPGSEAWKLIVGEESTHADR